MTPLETFLGLPVPAAFNKFGKHDDTYLDHYGALQVLADHAGVTLPERYTIRGIWMHGCMGPWDAITPGRLLVNSPRMREWPVFVARQEEADFLRQHGIEARPIGLPIVYAPEVEPVPARMPGSLLVMPTHTLNGTKFPDRAPFRRYADEIKAVAGDFSRVVVCVHPNCLRNGLWVDEFQALGFEILAGANTMDRYALHRVKMLMRRFETVATNGWGSHVAYALAGGAKVSIHGTCPTIDLKTSLCLDVGWRADPDSLRKLVSPEVEAQKREFLSSFLVPPAQAVADPAKGEWLIGAGHKLSPAAVRDWLGEVVRPVVASVSAAPASRPPHAFTNPPLEINNVDLYWTRASILRAVREAAPQFHGVFLDIGCGVMPYRDIIRQAAPRLTRYIGLDIETPIYKAEVDLRWDGRKIPLEDASVDSAMLTEVLEHCPEPWVVLKEARRVLKPGGVLFFTVPYIWPLHDAPWDFFRYTPFALEKLLAEAGFADVKLQALGGWNASLAQMIGLWLKRAPLATETRQKMARELWPLFQELVRTDQLPTDPKAGNTMATGWTGLAHVPAAQPAAPARRTAGDLPVVLVRSHEFNYSETFVEDHVNFLSSNLTLVYGYPFPRFVRGGKSVLPAATEQKIQTALATKAPITAELWAEYTVGLAQFLRGAGAKAALVETGLMGAFVHEACAQAQLPLVVHFHGVDAFGRELLDNWLPHYRKFFGSAASVLAVSRAMHAQLLQLGAAAKNTLLAPYGVAVDLPALAAPAKAPPHFVAVGRFVEKKAPHLTLQAFAAVHRAVPEARLVMIGDGPLLPACQKWAAENGLADAVTFAGVQSREEVSRRMAASRAFVQHSLVASNGDSEGLPLAILEAGAHGLPVVSTRHAGIPDAVREGQDGFLVSEKDVTAMAAAMLRLAQDSALAARLGASFRARVEYGYSRQRSLDRLLAILRAAAERRPASELGEPVDVVECVEPVRPAAAPTAAPAPILTGLAAEIAEDRDNRVACLAHGRALMKEGRLSEAYLFIGEADRLGGGTPETAELLRQLEDRGALGEAVVENYRRRAGWVPRRKSARPRRILVVTNLLPPQEMGGYGRTVWEFSRELEARGHAVRVFAADLPHLVRKPTAEHLAFESNVRRTLRLFGDWQEGVVAVEPDPERRAEVLRHNHRTVLAAVKEFAPDAVMAGNLDLMGHSFVQEILNLGIPVVHRLGNAYPGYDPAQSPRSPLFCVAGCSEWVNANMRAQNYPVERYAVVPPGSPLTEYFRACPPQWQRLKIAFASLLMPYKGAHVLVEALAYLQKAGIGFECTIAGDSTNPEYVEGLRAQAAANGFADRLTFPGFLGKKELAALFARSNVLVFPSVFEEPFGKTQIEAMAAGLLVVSSGSGGASEIVRHAETGLIFRRGDACDLAEKLAGVQRHAAVAARLAVAGQASAFRFTTAASVDRLESLFQELSDAARRPASSTARKPA